jgi:hypothetical protein
LTFPYRLSSSFSDYNYKIAKLVYEFPYIMRSPGFEFPLYFF